MSKTISPEEAARMSAERKARRGASPTPPPAAAEPVEAPAAVDEPPPPPSSEVTYREPPEDKALAALDNDAPSMASLYGLEHLRQSEDRVLVDLMHLPPWPHTVNEPDKYGHGIGQELAARLGYGVAPGELVAVGAAHAGAGKTAFVMQIADGLALRCLDRRGGPLTPVFILSEMAAEALTYRTLARWTGHPAYLLRGGKTALDTKPEETRAARAAAADALHPGGTLQRSRQYMRRLDTTKALAAGKRLVDVVAAHVEAWREHLHKSLDGVDVVPIVVVDPLQRWQVAGDEVSSLNQLVTDLGNRTAAHRWITMVTSDTNKASAKGENTSDDAIAEGAGVFRGSYNLIHQADAVIYLRPARNVTDPNHAIIEAVPVKARWGALGGEPPAFLWRKENGRFFAIDADEMKERRMRAAEAAADSAQSGRKSSGGKSGRRGPPSEPPASADDDDDDLRGVY